MKYWWLAIRPKTLLAAIGPVLLATALAAQQVQVDYWIFSLTMACALLLQISVNLANDLFDGLSGVDTEHRTGPQRMLQSKKISASKMKVALITGITAAVICGIPLVYQGGWLFLLLGCCSVLAALAYSSGPFPLAANGLGEGTVFLFFGLIAVMGSYYLQASTLDWFVWPYAVICGLFSAAMMLVNNIRDITTDKQANKTTLAVVLGSKNSHLLYLCLLLLILLLQFYTACSQHWLLFLPLLITNLLCVRLVRLLRASRGAEYNLLLERTAQTGFVYAITTGLCLVLVR